jgi:hypothetical protein
MAVNRRLLEADDVIILYYIEYYIIILLVFSVWVFNLQLNLMFNLLLI